MNTNEKAAWIATRAARNLHQMHYWEGAGILKESATSFRAFQADVEELRSLGANELADATWAKIHDYVEPGSVVY